MRDDIGEAEERDRGRAGEDAVDRIAAAATKSLLGNAPDALAETKRLAMESSFGGMSVQHDAYARLVQMHAAKRQTLEASEGLASFAEKRAVKWASGEA